MTLKPSTPLQAGAVLSNYQKSSQRRVDLRDEREKIRERERERVWGIGRRHLGLHPYARAKREREKTRDRRKKKDWVEEKGRGKAFSSRKWGERKGLG